MICINPTAPFGETAFGSKLLSQWITLATIAGSISFAIALARISSLYLIGKAKTDTEKYTIVTTKIIAKSDNTTFLTIYIDVENVEKYVSLAEIEYKSGNILRAIDHARQGIAHTTDQSKIISFKIFIARAYAKIGKTHESNLIYRELIREKIYMPPVIMGLLYNNLHNTEKANGQLNLMKIFIGGGHD